MISDSHISDEELTADLNGELVNSRAATVAAHLRRCWQCRSRRQQLEDFATEFVRLQQASFHPLIGLSPGPKARLKASLSDLHVANLRSGLPDHTGAWRGSYSGVWTAQIKDTLEDHPRTLVCSGQLDLATAQEEIATNWIAAYRKYFRTQRPLPAHALFLKDRPWE